MEDLLARIGSDDWEARATFRAMCRRSLYYITKVVIMHSFEPNLFEVRSFKESCDWLQNVIERTKLGLLQDSRNTAKSYRSTVAIPIWIGIQRADPKYDHPQEIKRLEKYLAKHSNIKGPDTRIGVASESEDLAVEWVAASKTYWETNEILRWAFPELIWPNFERTTYGTWRDAKYFLPGRKNPTLRDPFLRAIGIKGTVVGGRLDLLIIDDLVSEKSCNSASELLYRCNWVKSAAQLLQTPDFSKQWASALLLVMNRWNFDDPNSQVHDSMPHWDIYARHIWKCGVHGYANCGRQKSDDPIDCYPTDESIWPEYHPDIQKIRALVGDEIYAMQWENSPSHKIELPVENFLACRIEPRVVNGQRMNCVVIPEQYDRRNNTLLCAHEEIPLQQLRGHHLSIDPAGADEESELRKRGKTARWCVAWYAIDPPTGRRFQFRYKAAHWPPDKAIEECYLGWREWSNMLGTQLDISCEKVAAQTLVATALRLRGQQDGVLLPRIEMVKRSRGISKDVNIRNRFGTPLGQRQYYLCEGYDSLPRYEARHFPTSTSKDWLDTAAQAEERFAALTGSHGQEDSRMRARKLRRRRQLMTSGIGGI